MKEVSSLHSNWKVISVGRSLFEYLKESYPEGLVQKWKKENGLFCVKCFDLSTGRGHSSL